MMSFLKQHLTGIKSRIIAALRLRLIWVTRDRVTFNSDAGTQFGLVAVIGREHYRERRKRYPVASRAELARVITMELGGQSSVFWRIGPLVDNAREVQFFELSSALDATPPRAFFWLPESLVLSLALGPTDIATIRRGEFSYFLAHNGVNQVRGGAIVSPLFFRMASGSPLEGCDHELVEADAIPFIETGLLRLRIEDWWSFRGIEWRVAVRESWRPVVALMATATVLYLGAVSAYFAGTMAWREFQLERLGAEVTPLLQAQREIDLLVAERGSMQSVFQTRVPAWPMWEVASTVWSAGGAITSLSFDDGAVIVNGSAPSAVKVLEAVASSKGISAAKFESGVRQSSNLQLFVIRAKLDSGGAR